MYAAGRTFKFLPRTPLDVKASEEGVEFVPLTRYGDNVWLQVVVWSSAGVTIGENSWLVRAVW